MEVVRKISFCHHAFNVCILSKNFHLLFHSGPPTPYLHSLDWNAFADHKCFHCMLSVFLEKWIRIVADFRNIYSTTYIVFSVKLETRSHQLDYAWKQLKRVLCAFSPEETLHQTPALLLPSVTLLFPKLMYKLMPPLLWCVLTTSLRRHVVCWLVVILFCAHVYNLNVGIYQL